MASITITEGTDNVRSKIVFEDSENIDKLTLMLPKTFTINVGDTVNYRDKTSTLKFAGKVQSIEFGNDNKEVLVWDLGAELYHRIVNTIYTSSSPEAIIESVITNYSSLTYVSTITSGVTISTYVANKKLAIDIINEMIEILLANYRVTKAGNFSLELEGATSSGKVINNTTAILDGRWTENQTGLINSVTVDGDDRQIFERDPELFNGTGSEATYTLSEIPIDIRIESPVGTVKTGYVEGSSTGDYTLNRENKQFTGTFASGTNNVKAFYTTSVPISVRRRDKASIDTYGQKDKVFKKPYIKTREEARSYANYILDRYSQPLKTSTWRMLSITEYDDFESYVPNQTIIVNDTLNSVSGTFIIRKVEREYPGGLYITIGTPQDDLMFYQKETLLRVKQLEEKDDNSTILNEDEQVNENATITATTSIVRQLTRTLPTDALYLGNTIPGLVFWAKGNGNTVDASGNGNIGTWSGTESYATGHHFPQAFEINTDTQHNTGNYISPTSNILLTTNTTFSFWYYTRTVSSGWTAGDAFKNGDSGLFGLSSDAFDSTINVTGTSGTGISIQDKDGVTWNPTIETSLNTWYNVILTIDASRNTTIYINNVSKGSTATFTSDIEFNWIGRGYANLYHDGFIQDIRQYNRVLDSNERSILYNSGLGLTSNTAIYEIGSGEDRVLGKTIGGSGSLSRWIKCNGDVLDYVGSTNGTWVGTETYSVGNAFDLAVYTDGSSYVQLGQLNLTDHQDFSINCRAYIETNQGAGFQKNTVLDYRVGGSNWSLYIDNLTPKLIFWDENDSVNGHIISSSTNITNNTWFSLGFTVTGNTWTLYLNGQSVASTSAFAGISNRGNNLYIGSQAAVAGRYFVGRVEDIRPYNSVLTDIEMEAYHNSGDGIKDNSYNLLSDSTLGNRYLLADPNIWNNNPDLELPNMLAYYNFENQDGTDASGSGNDIATLTNTTFTTGLVGSYAINFNGTDAQAVFPTDTLQFAESKTLMFWIKRTGGSDTFLKNAETGTTNYMALRYEDDIFRINASGVNYDFTNVDFTISTSVHIGIVKHANSDVYLYINGVLKEIQNIPADFYINYLGRGWSSTNWFQGQVDDFIQVNRACTSEEIKARVNSGSGRTDKYASWQSA